MAPIVAVLALAVTGAALAQGTLQESGGGYIVVPPPGSSMQLGTHPGCGALVVTPSWPAFTVVPESYKGFELVPESYRGFQIVRFSGDPSKEESRPC
jgi:hypothetical protein